MPKVMLTAMVIATTLTLTDDDNEDEEEMEEYARRVAGSGRMPIEATYQLRAHNVTLHRKDLVRRLVLLETDPFLEHERIQALRDRITEIDPSQGHLRDEPQQEDIVP